MLGGYDIRPRQVRALIVLLILLPLLPTAVMIRYFIDSTRSERELTGRRWDGFYTSYGRTLERFFLNQLEGELDAVVEGAADAAEAAERISARADVARVVVRDAGGLSGWEDGRLLGGGVSWPEFRGGGGPGEEAVWRPLRDGGGYGRVLRVRGARLGVVRTREQLDAVFDGLLGQAASADIRLRVGEAGEVAAAPDGPGSPDAVVLPVDRLVGGWVLAIHPEGPGFGGDDVAEQARVYGQLTLLMLGVILTLGALAGYGITRQLAIQDLRNTALASVAHELKTPIASSRVLLDTLRESGPGDAARTREYLDLLAADNERLGRIVSDFLLLSRLEQKRYKPRFEVVGLCGVIDGARAAIGKQIEDLGFVYESRVPEGLRVLGDREALVRVFTNLFENALVHASDGRWLGVSAGREDGMVAVRVADRGPGIPRAEARRIFSPFYQTDTRLSRQRGGVGLGLSIVRQIVDVHRGRVRVTEAGSGGSVFTVTLPAADAG